jgi:hypothetical protein
VRAAMSCKAMLRLQTGDGVDLCLIPSPSVTSTRDLPSVRSAPAIRSRSIYQHRMSLYGWRCASPVGVSIKSLSKNASDKVE